VLAPDSSDHALASSNLSVLELTQMMRSSGWLSSLAPQPEAEASQPGPLVVQLIPGLSPETVAQFPEGQVVEISVGANPTGPEAGTNLPPFAGPGFSVTGMAIGEGVSQRLGRSGFQAAGENAIGLVAFPQSRGTRGAIDLLSGRSPRFGGSGPFLPHSRILLGHTALYVRQGGAITHIQSFAPASTWEALTNFGAMRSGTGGVSGSVISHLDNPFQQGGYMFDVPGARSLEFGVPAEWAGDFAGQLPGAGATPDLRYTAQPELGCGENCLLWAEQRLSRFIAERGGAPGYRLGEAGGPPIVDVTSGGRVVPNAARQQVLVDFIENVGEGRVQVPEVEGVGPVVASGASRTMRVIRFGGQLFQIGGYVYSGYRIATAEQGELPRVVGEEVGGQIGGAAGFAGGMGACYLLGVFTEGIGLVVCGIVGGVAGGAAGTEVGGAIGEAVGAIPEAAFNWYTNELISSPDETVRNDGVALRRAVLNDDPNAMMYLMNRMAGGF
jgi:hypothetical protein